MRRLILACVLSVAACETPAETQARLAAEQAQRDAADTAACAHYGFHPGQDGFANCRLQMDLARQRAEQARQQLISNALAAQQQDFSTPTVPSYSVAPAAAPSTFRPVYMPQVAAPQANPLFR